MAKLLGIYLYHRLLIQTFISRGRPHAARLPYRVKCHEVTAIKRLTCKDDCVALVVGIDQKQVDVMTVTVGRLIYQAVAIVALMWSLAEVYNLTVTIDDNSEYRHRLRG